MECPGPRCALALLEWLKHPAAGPPEAAAAGPLAARQPLLWSSIPYSDEAATIRSAGELQGAFEHLEYAVFRRFENVLTKAERARLDNSIRNALFKVERYLDALAEDTPPPDRLRYAALRERVDEARELADRQRALARRADLKLAQLTSLTPEGFEEFVGELFEALGFEVEHVGGTGDEGADLRLRRGGLLCVAQCKYLARSVVGSPELQKFLGTVHHTRSHKGFFVTTSTFSLAAEKFTAAHPIELIDGPRLVEMVHEVLGPGSRREPEPSWF